MYVDWKSFERDRDRLEIFLKADWRIREYEPRPRVEEHLLKALRLQKGQLIHLDSELRRLKAVEEELSEIKEKRKHELSLKHKKYVCLLKRLKGLNSLHSRIILENNALLKLA